MIIIGFIAFAQKTDDVVGVWLNPKGSAKIKIFKTGEYYFGSITWFEVKARRCYRGLSSCHTWA